MHPRARLVADAVSGAGERAHIPSEPPFAANVDVPDAGRPGKRARARPHDDGAARREREEAADVHEVVPVDDLHPDNLCNVEFSRAHSNTMLLNSVKLHVRRGHIYGLLGHDVDADARSSARGRPSLRGSRTPPSPRRHTSEPAQAHLRARAVHAPAARAVAVVVGRRRAPALAAVVVADAHVDVGERVVAARAPRAGRSDSIGAEPRPDELQHGLRARRPTWSAPGRRRRGRVRACRAILGGRGASSSARMSPASPKARIENRLDDGGEGQRDPLGAAARTVRCNAERVRSRRADLDRARGKPRARDGRPPFSGRRPCRRANPSITGTALMMRSQQAFVRCPLRGTRGARCEKAITSLNETNSRLSSGKSHGGILRVHLTNG